MRFWESLRSVGVSTLTIFLIAVILSYARKARPAPRIGSTAVLRYPGILRGISGYLFLIGLAVAIMGLTNTAPTEQPVPMPVTIEFAFVSLLGGFLLLETFTTFLVDSDGVTRRPIIGRAKHIQWSEVRRVILQRRPDGKSKGTLNIVTQRTRMTISAWLVGRPQLAERLADGVPPAAFRDEKKEILRELGYPARDP